jgi:hypothetical protein
MSWIKDNKFVAALVGATLVGAIALYLVGSQGVQRYQDAKERFDTAASEASEFERLALYPKVENRDGKRKAIEEYRKSVESLQAAFQAFRPQEIKNISPQEFTTRLLSANTEVRKAFEESGAIVPEPFFLGFESYKTSLASPSITGILDYQLASVKNLMLALAKAKPTELKNFSRPMLSEEEGQAYAPAAMDIARPLPVEITFSGPEASVRNFLSSITKPESQYVVVRALRIVNEKKDPPRATDAKYDQPTAPSTASGPDLFSGGFVLPGDETAAPADGATAPANKAASSGRILSQVLGDEEVQVFIRLDVLQFLPEKKLP